MTATLLTKGLGAFVSAWIALAGFARTQALSGLGARKRAGKLAERALDTVPADAYDQV